MFTTPYHDATKLGNKLDKPESIAVLENGSGRDSTSTSGDAKLHVNPRDSDHNSDDGHEQQQQPTIALDLSIRRGRLVLLTVLAVAGITAITLVFSIGVEVGHFDADTKNETQREQLLDDYNSYSANIASAFGKPIESVVTIAVQIVVLRFLIASMTKPELGWKVGVATVALSAAIGYLINNGFNAVNVQLRSKEIKPMISVADLSTQAADADNTSFSDTADSMRTTTELVPKNPITNTILRNLVRTREPKAPSRCNWFYSMQNPFSDQIPDTMLDYGFSQRDWQSRVLPEALEPKNLRLVANATDKAVNQNVSVADLPMDASLAADLFIYGMEVGAKRLQWAFRRGEYQNATEQAARNPGKDVPESAATMIGLLPRGSQSPSETEQREWLLREIKARLPRTFIPTMVVTSDLAVEFSRVEVSPTIQFDAMTIEIEVNPSVISNNTGASGWKTQFGYAEACGPWPALCMIQKTPLLTRVYDFFYDTHVQVFALGSCVNNNGEETLTSKWNKDSQLRTLECFSGSNSSMIVGSIGKRLVADSIQQNVSFDERGTSANKSFAVVSRLRKIYSFTIGRLSWKAENLADAFGAGCEVDGSSCEGIQLPLLPPLNTADVTTKDQRLVAGVNALPVSRLPLIENVFTRDFLSQPLVELKELPRVQQLESLNEYAIAGGDPLFLHNVKTVQWDTKVLPVMNNADFQEKVLIATDSSPIRDLYPPTCRTQVEDRLYLAIKNHLYMEHSLQPAYTAATFYLFQNAVVKDTIKLSSATSGVTLNFQKNVETIALFASIPTRNAWLTYAGCIVLVMCISYALLVSTNKARESSDASLSGPITEPHVIARVMLDEDRFPPAVLHRHVVREVDAKKELRTLDEFTINGISLQPQDELTK